MISQYSSCHYSLNCDSLYVIANKPHFFVVLTVVLLFVFRCWYFVPVISTIK